MEGDAFLPSEIARLVLGYLKRTGCNQAYGALLKESPHLKEYVSLLKQGTVYPTTIHGKNLEQMLHEYGRMLLGLPNQQLSDALHKKLDSLLDRLACLETLQGNNTPGCQSSHVHNAVLKSDNLRRKSKFNANYCHVEKRPPESSSIKKHTTCSRSGPNYGKQINMGLDSGIVCDGQRTATDFGSSSPLVSVRDKVNYLQASHDDTPNCGQGQSSVCGLQGWNLTPVLSRDQMSYASTISSSSEVMSPMHVGNKAVMAKVPESSFNLPELIDTLRNSSDRGQSTSGRKAPDTQQHKENSPPQQQGLGKIQQATPISSRLPDFDQLSFSPEDSTSSCQKANNSRAKSKKSVPSSMDHMLTPVKNVTQEQKPELKIASPRRKRQLPKRRSTSSDFPLIGRPCMRPTQSGPVESCITNSNDSFMSQASQGFVPCIEELCQNSRFAEKLAESINKVSEIKLGNKPSNAAVEAKSTTENRTEGNIDLTGQTSSHAEKKTDKSNVTSDLLDQLLMEDTVNNIIDMTTNDPDFDVLFNMFHVDKNEFIEKEYGVKMPNQLTSSQSISFASILDSDTGSHTGLQIHQPNHRGLTETETDNGSMVKSTDTNGSGMAVDTKDERSDQQTSTSSTIKPTTSVVPVSDLSGTVLHVVPAPISTKEAITESTDCNTTIQDNADSLHAMNTTLNDSNSHLIELVFPAVDGKGSTVEVVEVITIAADQARAPSKSGKVAELTQHTDSAAACESDIRSPGTMNAKTDKNSQLVHSCGKSGVDSASDSNQILIQAVNRLNTLLSNLNQALIPEKVSETKEKMIRNLADGCLLPELTQLSQSTIGKLVQLQQQLTGCSPTSHLPATNAQLKTLEHGSDIVIIPPSTTSQSSSSTLLYTSASLDETGSKAVIKSRHHSSLEPKAKRRKQSVQLNFSESTSDRENVTMLGQKNRSTEDKESSAKYQTSQKAKESGTKSKPRKKKNNTFVDPWKVNHQQDKRKYLGILWKHGSAPVDKVIVSEESASLLVGHDLSDEANEQFSSTPKQTKHQKVEKNAQKKSVNASTLPELSAKDVVDVANSPGVASSVDTSCLALTSLSGHHLPATSLPNEHSCTEHSSSPNGDTTKPGNHVRMLNFGPTSIPEKLSAQEAVDSFENPSVNMSMGPSMPSSFDFVFDKNKQSQSVASNAQSLAEKKEETEVAKTLISLATLPILSQKEEAIVQQTEMIPLQKDGKDSLTEKLQQSSTSERLADECTENSSVLVKQATQTNGISIADNELLQRKYLSTENSMHRMKIDGFKTGEKLGPSSTFQLPKQVIPVSKNTPVVGCVIVTDSSSPNDQQNQNHINMRVATKPKSIEKRKLEESKDTEVRQLHCEEVMEKIGVRLSLDKSKTPLKQKLSQGSSQVSLREESDSSPSSARHTPFKCEKVQLSASNLCSPKRTHVLTKLIEQGMKAKSPKLEKTCDTPDHSDTNNKKGARVAKISLSDLDMEKILSKIHK